MKELLTPAFIKQKTEAKDQVFRARIELVLSLTRFSSTKTFLMKDGFSEYKQQNEMSQNKGTYTECNVNDLITIYFGQTGTDNDNIFDLWIQPHGPFYYQVDPKLYPILRSFTDPKVKMGDLTVEIKHYTKTFGLIGEIDQVLVETLIHLGKYNYAHKVDKVSLTYATRRYKNTITLTVSPKVVFKVGQPDQNYVRDVIDVLAKINQFYRDYE
jgi:hypothetical protein|nr:MAG TPA: hypothetical protein [Myoviridae sp. ctfuG5]